MKKTEAEDLFIASLDQTLNSNQNRLLSDSLAQHPEWKEEFDYYQSVRQGMKRKEPATFGPFFAERIMTTLENLKRGIDLQIIFYFKKYQLTAIGVLVALLAFNVLFSDQLSVQSVLGLESETVDELVNMDLYDTLNIIE